MAIRVSGLGGWKLGRKGRARREKAQVTTVEQAARLSPRWAHVEARHASEVQITLPLPGLYR